MMEYKGYVAETEYDDIAKVYCGSVINTAPCPIATFHADHPDDLFSEFQISVDEYLAWCAEDGVVPVKPMSATT
ncbi:hypothetical protein GBAR_LOCUS11230 [Geodia barretti]|uniref:Uncharacterized protein n=1 Tax=Geodia barretti TaxID=519541 RepID=A0AA35RXR1_GEOBA|nr:hypothetical protein GBAR_LOCUS11230 [Geodia barretti]